MGILPRILTACVHWRWHGMGLVIRHMKRQDLMRLRWRGFLVTGRQSRSMTIPPHIIPALWLANTVAHRRMRDLAAMFPCPIVIRVGMATTSISTRRACALMLATEMKVINWHAPRVDVETPAVPWQVVTTAVIFMIFI
jgi:hypothetical protein